jgi:hypothetical protein
LPLDVLAIFCGFVVLQVMEFEVLFFMECQHLDQMLVVEHCFLNIFCLVMHDLLMGKRKALGEEKK